MPKSLAFGNGTVLVCLDSKARLRDLYFPYVGLENHVGGGYMHRMGIWDDGRLSWLDESPWQVTVKANESFQGISHVAASGRQISVDITDTLAYGKNIFIRRFEVSNSGDSEREVRYFVNQQFEIYHSEKGDTAFYDPETRTIIHYEGKRAFLIGTSLEGRPFDDYSVGVFQMEGKEGTYKDAEDGVLSKNAIEHGRVDSTVGVTLRVPAKGKATFYYWITIGSFIEEAKELHLLVLKETPEKISEDSADFWKAWAKRLDMRFYGLSERAISLFRRSQFYLRSHVDHRGAIIASGDSDMLQYGRDTYSYMWPRDAAYVAVALDWIGDRHNARKFFEFLTEVITKDGYLMHKYRPDRSLGSSWHGWMVNGHPELPIQEDETALILWALWEHWLSSRDLDFIANLEHTLIMPMAEFLMRYRDEKTGLPKQSYNLWEEKFAVHTYTAASVYGGLEAASRLALLLGNEKKHTEYQEAARTLKDAIVKHCFDAESGTFIRSIIFAPDGKIDLDRTVDASSAYGVFLFGVLSPDDERLIRAMAVSKKQLTVETPVGGIARYMNDQYYRTRQGVPGNPWIITTLWYAQYAIALAKNDHDLDDVRRVLNWVEQNATQSGILPEQLDPYTREPMSAAPLTWSHAEYIRTVILYLRKVSDLGISRTV
jgi:oligosaccharide amylase